MWDLNWEVLDCFLFKFVVIVYVMVMFGFVRIGLFNVVENLFELGNMVNNLL